MDQLSRSLHVEYRHHGIDVQCQVSRSFSFLIPVFYGVKIRVRCEFCFYWDKKDDKKRCTSPYIEKIILSSLCMYTHTRPYVTLCDHWVISVKFPIQHTGASLYCYQNGIQGSLNREVIRLCAIARGLCRSRDWSHRV